MKCIKSYYSKNGRILTAGNEYEVKSADRNGVWVISDTDQLQYASNYRLEKLA